MLLPQCALEEVEFESRDQQGKKRFTCLLVSDYACVPSVFVVLFSISEEIALTILFNRSLSVSLCLKISGKSTAFTREKEVKIVTAGSLLKCPQ